MGDVIGVPATLRFAAIGAALLGGPALLLRFRDPAAIAAPAMQAGAAEPSTA
jgi:hypothetical protein